MTHIRRHTKDLKKMVVSNKEVLSIHRYTIHNTLLSALHRFKWKNILNTSVGRLFSFSVPKFNFSFCVSRREWRQ